MINRIGQRVGNYQILSLLSKGGFSEVYLGEHIYLKSKAALKFLHTRVSEEDVHAFQEEGRLLASLIHPRITRVLDFGLDENIPFLVLDYAPNGSLRRRHPRGTILPLPTIVAYVQQVAEGLQYAHEQKVIHRDIKPENMLLGWRHEVLISDFGVALMSQSTHVQGIQEIAGTAAYMAPEQLQGQARPASDQYALAIVTYEWLCGEHPFKGSFTEIASQHLVTSPPSLRAKIPTISADVEQVVFTGLAKDPRQRFANVQAYASALRQAWQMIPIFPLPPRSSGGSSSLFIPREVQQVAFQVGDPSQAGPGSQSIGNQSFHPSTQGQSNPSLSGPSIGGQVNLSIQGSQSMASVPPVASSGAPPAVMTTPVGPQGPISQPGLPPPTDDMQSEPSQPILPMPETDPPASEKKVSRRRALLIGGAVAALVAAGGIAGVSLLQKKGSLAPMPAPGLPTPIPAMFGLNAQHTRYNSDEHILSPSNVSQLTHLWTTLTDGTISTSSPLVVNGVLYIGNTAKRLYAMNATTGKILWSTLIGDALYSSPAFSNGIIYIGSLDQKLYAVDATSGKILWTTRTGGKITASPAISDGIIYQSVLDGKLYAIKASNGAILWQTPTGAQLNSSAAVANNVVYVGSWDHNMYALHAKTGAVVWATSVGGSISSSPAVSNGMVYVGSWDGKLYAFDVDTGKIIWQAKAGKEILSSPAVANGMVYFGSKDWSMYGADIATGSVHWTRQNFGDITSSPIVANGLVYYSSWDYSVYAATALYGDVKWTSQTGYPIESSPTVANGVLYVGSNDQKVYAYALPGSK